MIDKPDTPPAEPPVNETIFEKQDRVLHDMGNPQPKESKQWLREYAAKMLEADDDLKPGHNEGVQRGLSIIRALKTDTQEDE